MPEPKRRMTATAFREQWLRAKEEIRLLQQQGLEIVSMTVAADTRLDSLFEGVTGEEAPDITDIRDRRVSA